MDTVTIGFAYELTEAQRGTCASENAQLGSRRKQTKIINYISQHSHRKSIEYMEYEHGPETSIQYSTVRVLQREAYST